ncbi:unnamed protein product [Cylicocyclus nassatus]|uniref:Uncharacterized protein n=1 Tax=Cylicocyclus nassatus TaxID=53992 RepID=A0AA36DR71_CYLNA|nr:unnamed protein product [Cylicocyclus nassatus]
MEETKDSFNEDEELARLKEKKNELASQPLSFDDLNNKFLKKQVEKGASLQEIATDFAKAQAISSILNDDSEDAEKTRKELKDIQQDTLKEDFNQDKINKQKETINAKQEKAEAFYKSFRPILEFDFSNLIKKKEKDNGEPKSYRDRSYGIPLMEGSQMLERRPLEGFEEDYNRFVARKEVVVEEVKAEFERVLAERTAKLDVLINETSTMVEIPDEEVAEECENSAETVVEE